MDLFCPHCWLLFLGTIPIIRNLLLKVKTWYQLKLPAAKQCTSSCCVPPAKDVKYLTEADIAVERTKVATYNFENLNE